MTDKAPERIWASYPEGWFSAFGNNKLSAYVRADIHNAVVAERDAALNKAESLGWAVDALKQSVETMERRAGEFKAERDKLKEVLQDVYDDLLARGRPDMLGGKIVSVSVSVWIEICKAIGETENDQPLPK